MDEQWLRDLLDRTTAGEPPIGSLAVDSLRAGIKRRRRRRAQGTVACVAVVALIGTAAVAATGAARHPGTGASNHPASGPARVTGPTTTWVLSGEGNLYAIPNSTKLRSKKILLPGGRQFMAITPNGKTIYVSGDEPNAVVPVSAVTRKVGKPIEFGRQVPAQILITPNGKTAYVMGLTGGEIYPVATATNTIGKPIRAGQGVGGYYQMAITPDGKTLYDVSWGKGGEPPSYVIPISTATNTPGKPIKIQSTDATEILMNPDGKTVYAIGQTATDTTEVVPISTATNTPGQPGTAYGAEGGLAITPDGQAIYFADRALKDLNRVIPFSTAAKTAGKLIKIDGMASAIAVAPDGSTAYVASQLSQKPTAICTGETGVVTPISTATNRPGRPVRVACDPYAVVVTPDGKTVWVGSSKWVTPISTATNQAGTPITFRGSFVAMVVGVTP
jgi:DNA-binding beta-propeller fold protein YncE